MTYFTDTTATDNYELVFSHVIKCERESCKEMEAASFKGGRVQNPKRVKGCDWLTFLSAPKIRFPRDSAERSTLLLRFWYQKEDTTNGGEGCMDCYCSGLLTQDTLRDGPCGFVPVPLIQFSFRFRYGR